MKRVLLLVVLQCSLCAMGWTQEQGCKSTDFVKELKGAEFLSRSIGGGLDLRLNQTKDSVGWSISVSPRGINEDWTLPVNLPLTGESQYLASGYGGTVKQKLQYPHKIRFVLSRSDYTKYSQLALRALNSANSGAASEYMKKMSAISTGMVLVTPLQYVTSADGLKVRVARLRLQVVTPQSFSTATNLAWHPTSCPTTE
jgi:hypothetical protein